MTCSVVIPCYNGVELTRACLHSLRQGDSPPREILVVDNGSTDATAQLDRQMPGVRVLRLPENRGFAGGVNAGIRAATSETVLILNNDTQAAPNLLQELHAALTSDARIAAVGAVSNEVKGHAQIDVGRRGADAAGRAAIAAELQHVPMLQDTSTLSGLCLLVRRQTLAEVGLFDERFGHGNFEDDDFCLRLRLHGHRLVLARRAFVHHEGHATFRALGLDMTAELQRRRRQFDAKWRHDPAGRATIAALDDDIEGAAAAALAARVEWPRWPDADWHLGRMWTSRGNFPRATAHFAALLRQSPRHIDAWIARGACQLQSGDEQGAWSTLGAVAREPLGAIQRQYLFEQLGAHCYRSGNPNLAIDHFQAAVQIGGDARGALRNWIGLCHLAGGDLPAANDQFLAAARAGFRIAHTNLGICAFRRGDLTAARTSFGRAVELAPDDPVARENYAKLCETAASR